MQSEKQGRRGFSRSDEMLNSSPGFGSRESMMPSLFGGRDPFDDPFFNRPLGDMFGSSMFRSCGASSVAPQSGSGGGIIVEELDSDDEEKEDEGSGDGRDKRKERVVSSSVPSVEHPDDDGDDVKEEEGKNTSKRGDFNKVRGTQPQGRSVSFQRVTYGGIDGAYYTSTRNRKAGNDGVMIEETKEADRSTGQATHKISRGIHDKGHSVTRKLKADGKVDTLQTLHNLNEDELAGFEEAWDGNFKVDVPGWKEFDNQGGPKGTAPWNTRLLPSSEQPQSSRRTSGTTSDGRTRKVVRINIE